MDTVKRNNPYHLVPLTFVGVVRELPTTPKDSLPCGPGAYDPQQVRSEPFETVLMRTSDQPAAVAQRVRALVGSVPDGRVNGV